MHIYYENGKIERECTDYKFAKKKYPEKIAKKLFQAINFIEEATSLKAVKEYRPFYFHSLKGSREGQYAIDIGGRRNGYRLIMYFDVPAEEVFNNAVNIREIMLKEMGKHYE